MTAEVRSSGIVIIGLRNNVKSNVVVRDHLVDAAPLLPDVLGVWMKRAWTDQLINTAGPRKAAAPDDVKLLNRGTDSTSPSAGRTAHEMARPGVRLKNAPPLQLPLRHIVNRTSLPDRHHRSSMERPQSTLFTQHTRPHHQIPLFVYHYKRMF